METTSLPTKKQSDQMQNEFAVYDLRAAALSQLVWPEVKVDSSRKSSLAAADHIALAARIPCGKA